jgi:hypothetical protein
MRGDQRQRDGSSRRHHGEPKGALPVPSVIDTECYLLPMSATHAPDAPYRLNPGYDETPGNPGVSMEADEGIRTLDLRHGKATL